MEPYKTLEKLNISYKEVEHKKVMTSKEAEFIKDMIEGIGVKNLFLKSDEGGYFLVLTPDNKKVDLKVLSKMVNGRLSFASTEELRNTLKLEQGSVTPLGLINDLKHEVIVLIDNILINEYVLVHPLVNTKTISLRMKDLIRLIEYLKNEYLFY